MVAVGQVGVELVGVVGRLPDHETPVELDEITIQVGGSAAIAAGAAAALGCETRLGCKLAGDFLGGYVVRALRDAGVEMRGAVDGDRQLSPLSFTALGRSAGERRSFFTAGDAGPLEGGDVDLEALLAGADALLLDGHHAATQRGIAERARAGRTPVILDASEHGDGIAELIALADVLIASERLAAELAPGERLPDALAALQRLGPRAVLITLGAAGSIGVHGEDLVEQPTFPCDAVDPTGAGSVYHGTFAAALLSGLAFPRCMELASAAAALSCQALGPWAGIPSREATERLARRRDS